MKEAIEDGQIPPLWGGRLMGGIGSPALMLNYQLPYYPVVFLMEQGVTPEAAIKTLLITTYILSGFFMYWALLKKYGPWPALAGAVIYILAAYRFVDVYVRGALGECVAFMFPPLILGSYWRKYDVLLTLSLAGLFLSHPVGNMLFSVLFVGILIMDLYETKRWKDIYKYALLYLLAFAIAAYNVIPTLVLTKFTHYSPADSGTLLQFPTLRQLIHSPWGYGISTFDENDGMSFSVGYAQWLALIMSLIGLAVAATKRTKEWWLGVYMWVAAVISILLMLRVSTPVYKLLHLPGVIDYPWRILMIVVFVSSILWAWAVARTKKVGHQVAMTMLIIAMAIYSNRNHWKVNDVWRVPTEKFVTETGDSYGEYASNARQTRDMGMYPTRVSLLSGRADIRILADRSNILDVETRAKEPHKIQLNIMYFPGWEVTANNKPMELSDNASGLPRCTVTTRSDAKVDDSGMIACELPAGSNRVVARYIPLVVQTISNMVTLFALGGIGVWLTYQSFCRRITKKKQ